MEEEEASTSQSVKKVECEMPWPAYSNVFDFRPNLSNENNFAFACKFCAAGKIIHANKTSAANLKKHINTCKKSTQYYQTLYFESNMQHRTAKHPYKLKDIEKAKELIKTKRNNEDSLENPVKKKQQVLERWGSGNASQKMLNAAILRFIIEDIQPLSIVDSPAFINLVRIGLPSSVQIMCRKTVKTKLNQTYLEMKSALENKLTQIEVVSTTADLWSKAKRSFFGMTVHWINPENLKRESAALACRRIKGRHTYDILAKAINSIFLEFHIQNKTCCMTTDNGSNFVKAFQAFERIENEDEDSQIEFHNLNDLLVTTDAEDTNEDLIILPPHQRCASHTLNLIAKDTEKLVEDNVLYKKKYRIIFGKLSKLWSKQNQSTQIADKIKETCGVYLKTPVITRWNSTFDCVYQLVTLLKKNTEVINQSMDYCNLQRLTDEEIKFLEEYCQVMEPLARALDILQSDTGMYMGYFLPVLNTLQQKLKNLNKTNLTYCHSLVDTIQQSLNKRFLTTFEKKELIIATCLHPKFKLNWITGDKRKLAESYLEDLLGIQPMDNSPKIENSDDHDDFFIFEEQGTTHKESEEEELQRFLRSKNSNIEMLNEYPKIKKLFIKYNTALPSSASVERMFSVGGSVLTPQRGHLHDDTIEQQILLKINKEFR